MSYLTIVSYCLMFAFLVRSDEIQFSCRPKPGCSFEHCDPLPPGLRGLDGFDADLYRENNGYHIVCQRKGGAGYGDKDSNGDIVALKNVIDAQIESLDKRMKKKEKKTDEKIDTKLEELEQNINLVFVNQFEGVRQRVKVIEEKLANKTALGNSDEQLLSRMTKMEKKYIDFGNFIKHQIQDIQITLREECKAQIAALDLKFSSLLENAVGPYPTDAKELVEENVEKVIADEPACTDLPEVPYSTWSCTNGNNVGSRCVITCTQGHISEKNADGIECKEDKVWSEPTPKCVCKAGFAGETCEHTTYWSVFKRNIDSNGGLNLNFGGNPITCRNEGGFYRWKWVYKCFCTDLKTGRQAKCSNYQSGTGSCEHASSALIRSMADKALYPKPTDESSMPKNC